MFGPSGDLRSVTRSVVALLLGLRSTAVGVGGIDQPVLSFFPGIRRSAHARKDRITLRHLLTMSAGLRARWNEDDYDDANNSETPTALASRPLSVRPGATCRLIAPGRSTITTAAGGLR